MISLSHEACRRACSGQCIAESCNSATKRQGLLLKYTHSISRLSSSSVYQTSSRTRDNVLVRSSPQTEYSYLTSYAAVSRRWILPSDRPFPRSERTNGSSDRVTSAKLMTRPQQAMMSATGPMHLVRPLPFGKFHPHRAP